MVFIDGDHRYKGVKRDYSGYGSFSKDIIAFHDIVDSPRHRKAGSYVYKLWGEIVGEKQEIIYGGKWAGIGILYK